MAGVHDEAGINAFATTCLWRGGLNRKDIDCVAPNCRRQLARICGGSLSRYMLGTLEGVITGATTSRCELEKQRLVDNATRIHCQNNVDETRQHLFWECPAWDYIRRAAMEKFCPGVWDRRQHPVTRSSGITMCPAWLRGEWDRLAHMQQSFHGRLLRIMSGKLRRSWCGPTVARSTLAFLTWSVVVLVFLRRGFAAELLCRARW